MLDTTGFTHLVGPITELTPGQVTLTLGPQHLNVSGRMHGAMMMVVLNAAARSLARATAPDAHIQLASSDFGFVRPAEVNANVVATAQLIRATRTMLFMQASVTSGDQPLCTAALTFTLDAPVCALTAGCAGQHPSPGTVLRQPSNVLGQVIGDIHDEALGGARMRSEFEITSTRCQQGEAWLDDGMPLYVADSVGSRTANQSIQQLCVTVNLQYRRLASAPLGAWVRLETCTRQVQGDLVFVDGQFTVNGQAMADFSGIWKGMGAKGRRPAGN